MNIGNSIVRVRNPDTYTPKLKLILESLTFNEIPKVVGSYAYLNHKYPSDVDVFEKVVVNLNLEESLSYYENRFKLIIKTLLAEHPTIFITDFKIGEDKRFVTSPIEMNAKLSSKGYKLSNKDIAKKIVVLRWSPDEILQGYKTLFDGVTLTLKEALNQQAIVKLDVITWLEDKFRSVEVFYNLGYVTNDGVEVSFYPLGDYSQSLLEDIKKYSSPENYAPLRVIKRLWNLSKLQQCDELLKIIDPFLSSDAAALNQIKADIEGIKLILKSKPLYFREYDILNKSSDIYKLYGQITYVSIISKLTVEMLNFSKRISNHTNYEKHKEFSFIFDKIFDVWSEYKACGTYNVDLVVSLLDDLTNKLSEDIITLSKGYLQYIEELGNVCKTLSFV